MVHTPLKKKRITLSRWNSDIFTKQCSDWYTFGQMYDLLCSPRDVFLPQMCDLTYVAYATLGLGGDTGAAISHSTSVNTVNTDSDRARLSDVQTGCGWSDPVAKVCSLVIKYSKDKRFAFTIFISDLHHTGAQFSLEIVKCAYLKYQMLGAPQAKNLFVFTVFCRHQKSRWKKYLIILTKNSYVSLGELIL